MGSTALHARGRDDDPFAPVLSLGERAVSVGAIIGLVVGLATHGYASSRAMSSLYDMQRLAKAERATLHEFFWAFYDIDVPKPPEAKPEEAPPEPTPEPEPEPAPRAAAPEKDIYDQPPTPAKAAPQLTRDASPNDKIEDMTDTIVSGNGTQTNGMLSANGVGDKAVMNTHAAVGGVVGGVGTGAPKPGAAPAPTGPDQARSPGLVGGGNWNCPFPPEADGDQIDRADVVISVTVKPDGSPSSVSVVRDPGHGFGRAARSCAFARRFTPGLDHGGQAITMSTPPITVHFTR